MARARVMNYCILDSVVKIGTSPDLRTHFTVSPLTAPGYHVRPTLDLAALSTAEPTADVFSTSTWPSGPQSACNEPCLTDKTAPQRRLAAYGQAIF